MTGDSMANQNPIDEFEKNLKQIDLELIDFLKVNPEKGRQRWKDWFDEGHMPICGPGLTFHLALYPRQRNKYVKKYAKFLREMLRALGTSCNFRDLKDAVKKVLNDLIKGKKALGFGVLERFWEYMLALTVEAYNIITEGLTIRDDSYVDEQTGTLLETTITKLDTENEIHEKIWRDDLDPLLQKIWDMHKAGYSVRDTAGKLNIPKTKVHEILRELIRDKP